MMTLILGDCCEELKKIKDATVDIIYLDPPFFSQKAHTLRHKKEDKLYSFEDSWDSLESYLDFMKTVLLESHRVLKNTGSLFLHCDKYASHYLRVLLDDVFGMEQFQNEIIWSYKRWSNSKKGLQNTHQNIYFYSKSNDFSFNTLYTDYSPTTNLDQILQDREKNAFGKSSYKRDSQGNVVLGKEKKGVPLPDVWEIPFLNPKAQERVGYPTQKPTILLEQIIKIASNEGDLILDPFCGSGTTLVAAKKLNRSFMGIDISSDAINLSQHRLDEMITTESILLKKGKSGYLTKSEKDLAILNVLEALPVQRNIGIDGFLKEHFNEKPVPIKIQRDTESLQEAQQKLWEACSKISTECGILIKTNDIEDTYLFKKDNYSKKEILVLEAFDLQVSTFITQLKEMKARLDLKCS
jgi:site-specific DNA-methyltransferase (adenine-specific)